MSETIPIWDDKEIVELFNLLCDGILKESERGAVIIGTTHIEEQLKILIEAVLPNEIKAKDRKQLFKYPNLLSTFSARIHTAYMFRLIDLSLYNSLNALRSLRNNAAHSEMKFDLNNPSHNLSQVFDLGDNIPNHIKNTVMKFLTETKLKRIKEIFAEHNVNEVKQREFVNEIIDNKRLENAIKNEVPKWELIHGLTIISGLMKYNRMKLVELLEGKRTWF